MNQATYTDAARRTGRTILLSVLGLAAGCFAGVLIGLVTGLIEFRC